MSEMTFRPAQMLPAALDDATLDAQRPGYRGLLVGRLEALNEMIDGELESGKDRVRWAELKLRTVKELATLLKLNLVSPPDEDATDPGAEQERIRSLVALQLDDLAGREDG